MAEGTGSWLLFEFHCKRGDLFSEKYLATPIGQILLGLFPGRIMAEQNHPVLFQPGKVGRPPQIDFVILNEGDKKWNVAVETKWETYTPLSIVDMVWDLIRLELLVYHNHCPNTYFLISGFDKKVDILKRTHFYNISTTATNLFTRIKGCMIYLDLHALSPRTKKAINKIIANYPGITIPKTMRFDFPHSLLTGTGNLAFNTFVWKVNSYSKGGRVTKL